MFSWPKSLAEQDATEQASGAVVQERSGNWRLSKAFWPRSLWRNSPLPYPPLHRGWKEFSSQSPIGLSPVDSLLTVWLSIVVFAGRD